MTQPKKEDLLLLMNKFSVIGIHLEEDVYRMEREAEEGGHGNPDLEEKKLELDAVNTAYSVLYGYASKLFGLDEDQMQDELEKYEPAKLEEPQIMLSEMKAVGVEEDILEIIRADLKQRHNYMHEHI